MGNLPVLLMVILGVLLIAALVLIILVKKLRKNGQEIKTDYRALFFMGVTFTGAGVALATSLDNPGMYGLTAMGVIYMIMGATHRDQWHNENK